MFPRLQVTHGIDDTVYQWFQLNLLGGSLCSGCRLSRSLITRLICDVPQGSVLEPVRFIFYTADLMSLIESHGFSPHLCADDTQMFGSCRPTAVEAFSRKISGCVSAVARWMKSNKLQLNADKTEVLWCVTGRRQYQLPTVAVWINGVPITPV
jgi:Reverse transcriptase (RNA-dependent DNA polymerase)